MNKCFNNYGCWHKSVLHAYPENKLYSESNPALAPLSAAPKTEERCENLMVLCVSERERSRADAPKLEFSIKTHLHICFKEQGRIESCPTTQYLA